MTLPHATVLLRHDLPDGTHHFDWLLQRDDVGPLVTFRLDRDMSLSDGAFEGDPLPDHRRIYLTYEGPVSGNRGSVRRVAQGRCQVLDESRDRIRVLIQLGQRQGELGGNRQANGRFLFGEPENG